MSIEITATAASAAAAAPPPPPPPSLDITVYPHALGITAGGGSKTYCIPFRTIELMSLERRPDGATWALTIQTTRQTINLTSAKNLDSEFRAACMAYNMG